MISNSKESFPSAPVYFNGTDLMEVCSPAVSPVHLGRQLREQVSGSDGLVDDMISPKKSSARNAWPADMKDFFESISI